MMQKVFATVGISGSGKTTWAEAYIKQHDNWVLVDTDAIREELWGNANDQQNGAEVFRVAYERMNAALAEEQNVIFCATSTTLRARNTLRQNLPNKVELTFIWFPVLIDECIRRNGLRERHVPEEVIRRQYKHFQAFTAEEKYIIVP